MNSTTSSNTKETITYKTEVIPGKDIVLVKEREILIPIKTQTKTETYIIEENVPIDYNEEYDHHQGEILIEENSPQIEEEVEIVEQVSRTYESPKKSNLTQSEIFPEKSKTKFSKVLFASEQGSTPLKDKNKLSAMNMKVVSSVERSSNKKRGNNDSFISNLTQVTQMKKGPYDYTYLFRDDYITDEQAALSKSTFVNLKEGYRLSESQKSFSSIKDKEREHKDSDGKLTQGIRTDLNWENLPNALMNRSISHTMSSRGPRIPSTNRSINVGYANVGTINTNKPSTNEKEMQTSTTTTKVQTENWMKKPQSTRVRSYQMRTVNNNNNNNEQQQSATNTTVKDVSNGDKKMSYQQRREERRLRREKEEAENKKREEFYRLKREREQKELEEKRKKESDEHKQQMVIDELQRLRNLKNQNDIHNHPLTNVTTTTITTTNVKDVVVDDKEVVPHDNEVIVNTTTTKESELLPTKKVVIENKGDKIIKTTTKETVKTIVKEIHDEEPVQIRYINDNTNESVAKEHNNFVYVINGNTPSIKSNNINTTNTHLVDVAPQHQQTITETSVITRKQTQIKQIIDTNNEQQHNESIQPVVPEEITINNAIQPQSSSLPIMKEKSISPIKNNSNSNSKRIITEPGKESKLPITDPIQPTTLFKTKKNEKNLPLQVTPTDTTNVSALPVDKKEINLPLNINSNNSTPKKPQIVTHEEQRVDHKGKRLDDVLAKVNEKKFVGEPQVETRIIDVEKRQGTPKKEINNKDNDDGNVIMTTTVTTKKTLIVVKKEKTDDNNNVIKEDIGVLPLNKESNESKNVEQVKTVYINDNDNESKPKEEINVEKKNDNNVNSSKPDIQKETTVITTLTETTTKEEDKKENDDDKNKKKKNATLTKIKPKEITAPSYFYITDELIESKKDNDDDVNVDNTDKEVKKEEDVVVKKEVEKVKDEPNKTTTTTTTTTTITTITTTVTSKEEPKTDNIIYTSITTTDNKPKETENVSNLTITTLHKPEEQEPQKEHIIISKEPITKEETTITLKETLPISTKEPQTEIKEEHNTITSTIVNDDLPKKDNLNYTPTKHEPKTKSLTYITSTSNSYYPHQQDQQPSSSKFTTVITSSNTSTTPFDASLPPRNTPVIAPLRSSKPAIVRNQYVYKYEDEPFIEENYESTVNPNDIDSMLSSQDLIHKSKRQPLHEQKAIFKNYYGRQGQSYAKDLTEIFSQDILPDVTTSQIQSQRDNNNTTTNDEVKQPITHNTTTITTIVSTGETQTPNTEGNFRFKAIPPEPDPTQEEEEQTQKQFHKSKTMIPQYHSTLNEEEKESPICDDEHKEIEDNKLYNEKGVIPGIIKAAVVPKKESPIEIKEDDVNDNDNDQHNVVIKTTTITTTTTTTTNVVPDKEDDDNDTQEQNVIKFKFVGKNTNNQNNSRYHKNTVRYSVGDDKDDDEIVTTVVPGGKGSTNLRFDSKNKRYGDDDNVIVEEEVNDNKDKDKSSFDGCSNWRRFGKIAEKKENDDDCDSNKGRYDNVHEHRILMIEKEEPKEEKNDLSSTMNQWKRLSKVELPKETITYNNDNDEPKKEEILTTISEPVLVKEEIQQQDVPRYICVDNDNIEETPKTVEQQQETSQPEITTTVDQWKDLSEQPKKEEITTTTTTYVVNDDEQQPKETVTTTIHYIVDDEPKREETTTTVTEPVNNREIDIGPKELPRSKAEEITKSETLIETQPYEYKHETKKPELSSALGQWKDLSKQPKQSETKYTTTTTHYIVDDNIPKKEEISTITEPIKTQHIEQKDIPKQCTTVETYKTGIPIQPQHEQETTKPILSSTMGQWKNISKQPKPKDNKYTTTHTYTYTESITPQKEVTSTIPPEQLTSTETVIKHQSTLPNEKLQPIETPIQLSQQPTTNPLVEEEIIISPSTITETQYSIPKVKSSAPKQRHHLDQNESSPSLPSNINNINTLSINEPIEQTTIQQQIPLASPTQPEEPIEPEMQNQEDEIVHKFIEDIFNTVESEKDSISFQANANETQQQFTPITDLNNNETLTQDNIITIPQLPLNQQLNNNITSSSIIPQIDPVQSIPLIPINDNLNLEAPNLINIPQSITLIEDNNNQPQQIVNKQQLNIETVAEVYQPHRKHQEQVSQTQEIKTTTIHQQQQPQQQSYQPISSSTETQQQQQSITPNNNDQQLFHTISLKFGEVIFEQREIPINEVDTKLIQKPTLSSILKKQTSYEIQEEIIAPSSSNNIPVPEFERTRSSPTLKPQKVSSKNKRNVRLGKAIQFEDIENDPLITTNTFDYNPQLTPAFVATGASIDNTNNNTARKTAYPIKHKPRFETVVTESPSKYSHRTNVTNDFVPRKTAMTVMSLPKHILEEEEEDFHDVMQRGPQRSRAKKTKAKITSQKEHNPAQPANTPQHEDACGGCNGNENCVIM